jgi:hypothetical protein
MRLSKLPTGTVGAAPLSKGGVVLSGVLCGSVLACRFGDDLGTRAIAVFNTIGIVRVCRRNKWSACGASACS